MERSYWRRIGEAARADTGRKLGGRWTQAGAIVPAVGVAVLGYMTTGELSIAALGGLLIALAWIGLVALWSLATAPIKEDARLRSERDSLQDQLATRTPTRDGLAEFATRLSEGNALIRARAPRGSGSLDERQNATEAWQKQHKGSIRDWTSRCRETVATYLPERVWYFDQVVPPVRRVPGVARQDPLRHEINVKIVRMGELQKELAAQSNSPAISSQVHT
jgi:hypothetical protein